MNQIKHEFLSSFIFFNRNIYIYIFLFFHVINKSFQFYHLFEIYSSFKVNNHNETYRNIFTFEKTETRVKLHFCPSIRRRKSSKILQHSDSLLSVLCSMRALVFIRWNLETTESPSRSRVRNEYFSRDSSFVSSFFLSNILK